MNNLAGVTDCDRYIAKELAQCGLVPLSYTDRKGEVPTKIYAKSGPLTFHRAWSYWRVEGPVPLALAEELYRDPAADDIRVAGHCGCVAPEGVWVDWFLPNGLKVIPSKQEEDFVKYLNSDSEVMKGICQGYEKRYAFSDSPASLGAVGYISSYHIDSTLGLRVFVDLMKANNQHNKTLPKWWNDRSL